MIRSRCSAIVEHGVLQQLAAWEAFYVIIGTTAALTGLQFVVIVLGAEVNAPMIVRPRGLTRRCSRRDPHHNILRR